MNIEDNIHRFYENPWNYIYTEYQVIYRQGEKKQHSKWRPCVLVPSINHPYLPTTENIKKQYPRSELFFGQYSFADPTIDFSKDKAHQYYKYSDFIMESDHEQALEYSRAVVDFIIEELAIPTDAISLECSGGRSIHIVISGVAFGTKPSIELHKIQGEMVTMIMEATGTTFDKSIYKPRRVFRASGSYRPDKDTYKIGLSLEEFKTLTWEQILELCKSKRPEPVRCCSDPSPRAAEFYEEARTRVIKQNEDRSKVKHTSDISNKEIVKYFSQYITTHKPICHSKPPCIEHIIRYATSEELRHETCLFHATFCYSAGYTMEEAFEQISLWHSTMPHSRYSQELREQKLTTQLKSIYLDGTYSFYCRSYALKLHIPCSKNCPLWRKMNKLRAIDIPQTTDTNDHPVTMEEARELIKSSVNRQNIIIKTQPGTGKTITALNYCNEMKNLHPGYQYVYATARKNHLEELLERGMLPEENWQIIRTRIPIEEPYGNCYHAKEIAQLIKNRDYGYISSHICNENICQYWEECWENNKMYKAQWKTTKNLAMTHQMLAIAGGKITSAKKIFIDESPHKAFVENIEVKEYLIWEAKEFFYTKYEDRSSSIIFIALGNLISSVKKNKQDIHLTGKYFLERLFTHLNYLFSTLSIEDILTLKPPIESDNFVWRQDFIQLLKKEIQKYKAYPDYNSQISLRYYTNLKNIKFSFTKTREMKAIASEGIVGLDATTEKIIWEKVLGQKMEVLEFNIQCPNGTRIIQVTGGRYGKNYQFQNSKLREKLKTLIDLLGEDTYIGGWQDLKDELEIDEERFGHFYGVRGSNKYENYPKALVLGTPNIRPDSLIDEVLTVFHDEPAINFSVRDIDTRYNTNIHGKDFVIPVPTADDPRYQAYWSIYRSSEILQEIHRVRPLLKPKTIYILSNIPLNGMPPTELIEDIDALIAKLSSGNEILEPSNVSDVIVKDIWWMTKFKYVVENILYNDHYQSKAIPDENSVSFKSAIAYRDQAVYSEANITTLTYYIAIADQKLILTPQGKDLSSISKQTWQRLFQKFCDRYELHGQKYNINPPGQRGINLNIFSSNGVTHDMVLAEYISFNNLLPSTDVKAD